MRSRLIHVAIAFVAAFVVLALSDARVQLASRADIEAHGGDPRHAATAADRGALLDASGSPLAISRDGKREYPAGSALAQIVGYSSAIYGESGLEAGLDTLVAGADERLPPVLGPLLGGAMGSPPASGADVVLTLRSDIAAVVDRALPDDIRGAAVVMDPRSGAILAVVNRPSFDPNRLDAQWKSLRARTDAPLLDRGTSGLYPPGSTFKTVTVSAALDSGTVTPDDTFDDPGFFEVNGFAVHNSEDEVTGVQTVTGAFALSSNVDFAQIVAKVGADTFYQYLGRFSVGTSPPIPVAAAADEVPPEQDVSPSELAQMSFGQGSLAVTPLRMALVVSTIADRGIAMPPQLVRQIRVRGRTPVTIAPSTGARVISEETADEVRSMMIAVVRYGTGYAVSLPGVTVAGKTGTATHEGGLPDAWFVCFAPAEAPRLVVVVVVEDAGYGGSVSAPIARQILAGALPLYPR